MLTLAATMLTESAPSMVDLWNHAWGAGLALGVFGVGAIIGVGPGRRGRRAQVNRAR